MTRPTARLVAGLVAAASLAGCATRAVDVQYPDVAASRGLPAAVPARRVVVAPVTDRRVEKSRIGSTAKDRAPITTARPVPDIVREALVAELARRAHQVVAGAADVVVAAEVEEFWLDAVGRSPSTLYVGRVAIAVAVADGHTGDRLLVRRYVGIARHTGDAESDAAWRAVMDTALARTMHDLATDRDLAAAVGGAPL